MAPTRSAALLISNIPLICLARHPFSFKEFRIFQLIKCFADPVLHFVSLTPVWVFRCFSSFCVSVTVLNYPKRNRVAADGVRFCPWLKVA